MLWLLTQFNRYFACKTKGANFNSYRLLPAKYITRRALHCDKCLLSIASKLVLYLDLISSVLLRP